MAGADDAPLRAAVALGGADGKRALLRCLQWVSLARPEASPSRHTLKKLHRFFIPPPVAELESGDAAPAAAADGRRLLVGDDDGSEEEPLPGRQPGGAGAH